jgi:hypothetical protein
MMPEIPAPTTAMFIPGEGAIGISSSRKGEAAVQLRGKGIYPGSAQQAQRYTLPSGWMVCDVS